MNNKLFSTAIYRHLIEHFDSIEIEKLDTFPAVNEYRNVHAWMLLPFHEYYDSINKPPVDSTHKIKLAVAKAKKLVEENDENMDDITQPEESISITKTMKLEALKEISIDQARVCLMNHYDSVKKEYDITNVNTAPAHQLLYDLYFAIEDFQRWRPEENNHERTATPGKKRKPNEIDQTENEDMQFDDEDELKKFPHLMKAERYLAKDIENLPMTEVKKCLREYYTFSNIAPVDDYYDVESEENLRQHMFEAVVALLTHYNIGIKHTTTDEEIENMDTVFLYKELHKINVIANPAYKFHNKIATSINFARMNVTKYRDDLVINEKIRNTTFQTEEEYNDISDSTHEVLCDDDIIRRIQGRATAMGIQVYPRDLRRLTNSELQEELVKIIQKEKIQRPAEKKGRAYKELNEKEKQTQNLFGVYTAKFDPNSNEDVEKNTTTNLPPPKEKDVNRTSASAVKTTRVEIFIKPKLAFQGKTPNATKIIKEYLFQMRRADAMFKIHPVDKSNESQNDILYNEEDLPNNQMEMNPWVQNIKIKGNRLFFYVRVTQLILKE